ncbi:MAG: type 2 lanthipeptide synthetase LanM [Bryobacteraceae bacterium]
MTITAADGRRNRLLHSTAAVVEAALSPDEWEAYPGSLCLSEEGRVEAERLLARWRKLITLRPGTEGAFERRLATLGLDEAGAIDRLRPHTLPPDARLPEWAELLSRVLDEPAIDRAFDLSHLTQYTAEEVQTLGLESGQSPSFPDFLAPFLSLYLRFAGFETEDSCTGYFARFLLRRLSQIAARTIAYELRMRRDQGELKGASPEERFRYYTGEVLGSSEGRSALLSCHPVLARLLSTCTLQAIEATIEFLERLRLDRPELQSVFAKGTELGPLVAFVGGVSDAHDGGRSVWILRFDSGLKLVYKPRSLAMDAAFSGFIDFFNQAGHCSVHLRSTVVLPRNRYGWSEFIEQQDCGSEEEVTRYYRRQGVYASLVHFLCGVDFHSENFVAAGEDPMPIDLEGLLSLGVHVGTDQLLKLPLPLRPLHYTVAATMMLPYWRAGEYDRSLFSASGIAGSTQGAWPVKQPAWEGSGTDQLRLVYRYEDFIFDQSVPTRNGHKVRADLYHAAIVSGFVEGYRTILAHRDALLGPASPLSAFAHATSRVILRDTQEYVNLLSWCTSPDILKSGAALDVALETLAWTVPVLSDGKPCPELLRVEKRSLWQRDIPILTCSPMSCDVYTPGGQTLPAAVEHTSFHQMRRRIEQASEGDLEWQSELVRTMLQMVRSAPAGPPSALHTESDRLLAHAIEIGEGLARVAFQVDGMNGWLSLFKESPSQAKVQPAHPDPWSLAGAAGNAIFLSDLAAQTGEKRYDALARGALKFASTMLQQVRREEFGSALRISAYEGPFGLVYALTACGVRLGDENLVAQARQLALSYTCEQLNSAQNPDMLNGAAGALLALLQLYRFRPDPRLIERAQVLARVIQRSQVPDERGGWLVPGMERPLLGMAHGSSGMTLALHELYKVTGDDPLRSSARSGLEHERSQFSGEHGDWPDQQNRSGSMSFMTGWCAGAPGIGLARLRMYGDAPDDLALAQELETSIQATLRHSGKRHHHLCCGEAGRILFLTTATRILDRPSLRDAAQRAGIAMLDDFEEHGHWRLQQFCASLPVSGLLGGVPGVGLSLLELARPGSTSQVLVLA